MYYLNAPKHTHLPEKCPDVMNFSELAGIEVLYKQCFNHLLIGALTTSDSAKITTRCLETHCFI